MYHFSPVRQRKLIIAIIVKVRVNRHSQVSRDSRALHSFIYKKQNRN